MSIVTPSEREGIAGAPGSHGINESTPGVSVVEPKHGPQQRHEQQQLPKTLSNKSEADSLQLKQVGNDHFRKKDFFKAIQRYTLAIMKAPWPSGATKKSAVARDYLASLQLVSPAKYMVAEKLHCSTASESPSTLCPCAPDLKPDGTPLLATCFGNRSAALYELGRLEECLLDIDHAILHGYIASTPDGDKLKRRKEKCLARLQQSGKARQQPSSTAAGSKAEDHQSRLKLFSAFASELVTVSSSENRGRYIEAVRDLLPGDVVFSEEPYAAVLDKRFVHTHCSFCFKESWTLIPCWRCSSEGYCCSECQKEAWLRYHWLECPVAKEWKEVDWMMQLTMCLRIVLRAETDELLSAITNQNLHTDLTRSSYATIYSLVTHQDEFGDKSQKLSLEKMSDSLVKYFGDDIINYLQTDLSDCSLEKTSKTPINHTFLEPVKGECQDGNKDIEERNSTTQNIERSDAAANQLPDNRTRLIEGLRRLFHHHLLQLRCNSHFVSTVMSVRTQESVYTSSSTATTHGAIETTTEARLGSAIYPTASLMNHSCAPNAIFRFNGNRVVVCITEKVKSGYEVNNSYGPQIGRMKRSERQKLLRKKYFFDCNCIACSGTSPDLSISEVVCGALLCPKCMTGPLELRPNLTSMDRQEYYHCLQCQCSMAFEQLRESEQKIAEARALFKEGTSSNRVNISLLLKCLKEQSRLLHRHNLELAKTNDALAHAYAMQGDFQSAVPYCERSCETVGVVYGRNSVEVGNEKEKLSQLLFHSGHYESALSAGREALLLLRVYRGEDDQCCQELKEMIELLSSNKENKK